MSGKLKNGIPYLRAQKINDSEHEWKIEEWDTTVLGFLTQISPPHFPKEYAMKYVQDKIKTENNKPKFQILKTTVSTVMFRTMLKVQVYAIEVPQEATYRDNQVFATALDTPDEYIIVHKEDFKETRKMIAKILPEWIQLLDPSNTRMTGVPNLIQTATDDLSSNSNSQMSSVIEALSTIKNTVTLNKQQPNNRILYLQHHQHLQHLQQS
jgi:hypothetical protein